MSKINHHYIPQFHLRNFSSNGKSIGMFINSKELFIKNASIKEQAYTKHLYGKTNELENHLMLIESYISKIISGILTTYQLPKKASEEYELLLLYLLLAEARVQKTADSQNHFLNSQINLMAKMNKSINIPTEIIDKLSVSYEVPNLLPMQIACKVYPILLDLRPVLLISNCDRRFITSDNPLVRYNSFYVHRNYQLRGYGLGNMGIQLFYPMSPTVCLCLYDDVMYRYYGLSNDILVIYKGKVIDQLNKLFYQNSMNFIFFNSSLLETYLNRITNGLNPVQNIEKEVNIFGSEDDKIIWYQNSFVKDNINLPFIRINPNYINMKLPKHMAGPMRPYAQEFQENLDK